MEDLWDDLAGTPEAVPVHDWQKQELARRKANLLNNPASGLSWVVAPEAELWRTSAANPRCTLAFMRPMADSLIRRFPYAVFYEYAQETVTVYSVFHTSRDPDKWRERLL